jgi:hypothetical protein
MYQAANENFELKDLWQPGSQPSHLEKLATVSGNRLLVDKMIVWCTILDLIMATSQHQSHNLLAVFQMTDAKGS